MADIKLFNINGEVREYQSGTVTLEKELQTVIEQNMDTFSESPFLPVNTLPLTADAWTVLASTKIIAR